MSVQQITEEEYNKMGAYNTQISMFNLGQQKYVENKIKENRIKLREELDKSLNLPNIESKVKGSKLKLVLDRIKNSYFSLDFSGERILCGGVTPESCKDNYKNNFIEKNSKYFYIKYNNSHNDLLNLGSETRTYKYAYFNIGNNNDILFSENVTTKKIYFEFQEQDQEQDLFLGETKAPGIDLIEIKLQEPLENENLSILNHFILKTDELLNVRLNDFNKLLLKNYFLVDELKKTKRELELSTDLNETLESQSDEYIQEIEDLESKNNKLESELKTIKDDLTNKFEKEIQSYLKFCILNIFIIFLLVYINIVSFETFINQIVFISTKIYEISYLTIENIIYYSVLIINNILDFSKTSYNVIYDYCYNEL